MGGWTAIVWLLFFQCILRDETPNKSIDYDLRGAEKIGLEPYRQHEMIDILQGRVDAGLAPGSITDEAVEYIADLAAGDACVGITLLRRAAKRALHQEDSPITPDVVDAITDDARKDIRSSRIDALSTHKRLLFDIIREHGELSAGDLHPEYERQASSPKTRSARRRYLSSLETYDLITSHGTGRGTRHEINSS